jgi:hypothetical protein
MVIGAISGGRLGSSKLNRTRTGGCSESGTGRAYTVVAPNTSDNRPSMPVAALNLTEPLVDV